MPRIPIFGIVPDAPRGRPAGAAQLGLLERYGLAFMRRWNRRRTWDVRHLTAAEAVEVRRTERGATLLAALAGVVSGATLGITEMALAEPGAGELALSVWREQWRNWGAFLATIVVVSILEMLFLYWNAVRATGRISALAGLGIAAEDEGHVVPPGLARAALDLPDPREPVYGIDPFARTPRWKLTLFALLYRLKVGATSFVLRVFLRRLLGRAALRLFIPLLAIPVYALWNALVTAWVLRQVRIRSFGPAAIEDALGAALHGAGALSGEARQVIVSGVGELIVCKAAAHPNVVLLMERLLQDLVIAPADVESRWERDRARLGSMSESERLAALEVFRVAAVIDGRLGRRELRFLADAHGRAGVPFEPEAARRTREGFLERGRVRVGPP